MGRLCSAFHDLQITLIYSLLYCSSFHFLFHYLIYPSYIPYSDPNTGFTSSFAVFSDTRKLSVASKPEIGMHSAIWYSEISVMIA